MKVEDLYPSGLFNGLSMIAIIVFIGYFTIAFFYGLDNFLFSPLLFVIVILLTILPLEVFRLYNNQRKLYDFIHEKTGETPPSKKYHS